MAACDPAALIRTAQCFDCLSDKQLRLAKLALLVQWAGLSNPNASTLIATVSTFTGLSYRRLQLVKLALLCNLSA